MPCLRGDLSVMSLPDIVIWIANRAPDGVLTVSTEAAERCFTIEGGQLVRAKSSLRREALGQFLVNFGLVTEDQLQRAFEVQGETKVLLGRILVMTGIVPEEQMVHALRYQVQETLLAAMRSSSGVFIFDQHPIRRDRAEVAVEVPAIELHREAKRRAALWAKFEASFPDPKLRLVVRDPRAFPASDPDSMDRRVAQAVRAGGSIESIALDLHAPDFQVYARLHDLLRRGAIALAPAGGVSEPPPFEIEIEEDVDFAAEAEAALARADYARALGHAMAGIQSSPGDTKLARIRSDAESKLAAEIEDDLPHTDAVPVLAMKLDELAVRRHLSAKERYIASRVDGQRSLRAIMNVSPMRDVDALHVFKRLLDEGLISIRGAGRRSA